MNILAWMVAIGTLILLMIEAVDFHRATVCRQEAWLKSTEQKTRSLLGNVSEREKVWHLRCRIVIARDNKDVSWRNFPGGKVHSFDLELKGKL